MTEREWQRRVIKLAKAAGWIVRHISQSTVTTRTGKRVPDRMSAGIPDLILVRERIIWAELKTDRGKLRPAQEQMLNALNAAGAETYVWRPRDIDHVKTVLGARNIRREPQETLL